MRSRFVRVTGVREDVSADDALPQVVYGDEGDAVKTLHEAEARQSEHEWQTRIPRTLAAGDVDAALATAERVVEGTIFLGSSEHYYMEPHSAVATPRGECSALALR